MKKILSLFIFFSIILLVACTATNNVSSDKTNNSMDQTLEGGSDTNIPLDQYLRKIRGLRITGSGTNAEVQIIGAGNTSLMTGNTPLFVLDGVRVGTKLGYVSSLVQTANIQSVRVLKSASETSFYGSQGTNGVIVITTKKK